MSVTSSELFSGECRNCGATFTGHYCPLCGQGARVEVPTAREFLHEFFGHYIALEGKLLSTLKILFLAPGQLTLDYLEGRRQSRVLPLRLYLSCSVLFFLVLALAEHLGGSGVHQGAKQEKVAASAPATVQKKLDSADAKIDRKVRAAHDRTGVESPASASTPHSLTIRVGDAEEVEKSSIDVSSTVGKSEVKIKGDGLVSIGNWHGRIDAKEAIETFKHHIPHAIFALLPVFAAILALLYRSRRQRYGAHFLFALHLHAFAFLWLIPPLFVPEQPPQWLATLDDYWFWGVPVYLALALRRVYGGRWRPLILRILALFSLYGIAALVAMAALAVVAAMGSAS